MTKKLHIVTPPTTASADSRLVGRIECIPAKWLSRKQVFGPFEAQAWGTRFEILGRCFRHNPEDTSRKMSRWIQHPALVWTLLALFGAPNLLGQGFHIALHHSHHHSHGHDSLSAESSAGCVHSQSHAKSVSPPSKKHACCHHRHSRADATLAQRDANSPALSLTDATLGHDPHNCAACLYYSTAQALAKPAERTVSQALMSPLIVSSPAAVFCERYLASSPRGLPVA